MKRSTISERALVLAPRGRDATLAIAMLGEVGLHAEACASLTGLVAELDRGAAFVILTEEALVSADLGPLAGWLNDQEEWSDLPFVLLTNRGGGLERNPAAKRYLDVLGNVTFLERPFHPTTIISLAQSALRGRRRQYEARARLEALRTGEARYRTLFNAIDAGFCIIEMKFDEATKRASDYRFVEVNPAFAKQTGLKDAEGLWVRDLVPNLEQFWFDIYGQVAATGEATRFEHEAKAMGRYYDVHAFRVGDPTAHRVAILFSDISARRSIEIKLRESESRFQAIVDSIDQMIWSTQPDGFHDYYNQRWYDYTGVPAGSTDGEAWNNMFHPDDQERAWSRWQHSLATGDPYHIEYRLRHRSGQYRWVIGRAQCVRNETGAIIRWFGTCTDIHDLKVVEEERGEQSRVLEILNRTGAALAAELDLDRVVQMVTDAGVDLTGAQFGAFFYNVLNEQGESYMLYALSGVDRSHFEAFPMPRATAIFQPTFKGEGVLRSDDILVDPRYGHSDPHRGMPKGHLPVRSYLAVSVTSRSGEVIGGLFFGHPEVARFSESHERLMNGIAAQAAIAIDNARLYQAAQKEVEQRRRAENSLRELNETLEQRVAAEIAERSRAEEQLRQAQKMEAVGQLTGGVAHDFNNLLTIIKSSTDLLRRPDIEEARRRRYVDAISDTVDRAAKLTGQLLAFARRQALKPEVFDVTDRLANVLDMMRTIVGARIEIVTDIASEACFVEADLSQFETALINMAVNARDAMEAGGRLTVSVRGLKGIPPTMSQTLRPGRYVAVSLADTGSGIAPEKLGQIFEPFFTTKEVGKGTGLGLSQVYGFAKQSAGDVTVESKLGQGSRFTLYLPRLDGAAAEASAQRPQNGAAEPAEAGQGRRILVVEDNVEVGTFATQLMRDMGYETVWAENGDAALKVLAEINSFDAVFSDVVMPGMSGVELGKEIRRRYPGLPVVLTSGYSHVLAEEGRHGFELLQKPYAVENLSRVLRVATGKQARIKSTAQ